MIYGDNLLGIKKILNLHPDFKWNQFDRIRKIKFWIDHNECLDEIACVEIDFGLYSESYKPYLVKIRFEDTECLKLNYIGAKNQLLGFEIVNKGLDGWQKQYWINDYENSLIEFYCNSIEVVEIQEILD